MLDERGHLAVAFSAGVVACSCVGSRKDGGGGETGLVQLRNRHGRREDMRDDLIDMIKIQQMKRSSSSLFCGGHREQ